MSLPEKKRIGIHFTANDRENLTVLTQRFQLGASALLALLMRNEILKKERAPNGSTNSSDRN